LGAFPLLFNKAPTAPPIAPAKHIDAVSFAERGTTGLRTSGGGVYEEFVPRLQWPRAGAVYQEMSSNDAVITAILLCSKQLIQNVVWDVVPASDLDADKEAAEFVRQCKDDMSTTWADFIDDLSSFFEYGFSYHEIIYKRRMGDVADPTKNSKYDDGRIGWRKLPGRAQTSLQGWMMDDTGGLQGMKQYTTAGSVEIPIGRGLLFRTTANRGNPEGKSFLRGAYRSWYFKKHIEEIEGIGIERDLAGLPVVTAPPGVNIFDKDNPQAVIAKTSALKLVSSIRRDRNEGVVLPADWKLELLSSGSSRQFDTSDIINRWDQRIAITMLADIVMLGADKVGSFALAKVKQSMLAASLQSQLNGVAEVLNRYAIPRLIAMNTFQGLTGTPEFKVSSVVTPDLKELGDYIKALAGAKMPIFPDLDLENYLRRVANLPETSEEDENREAQLSRSATTPTPDPNADPTDPNADPVPAKATPKVPAQTGKPPITKKGGK